MAKEVPSARSSSEIEHGEVPEVAVLGNALTSLFNTLEMTQNAYAVRISMDKSIISRYLRGRRVATEDFIDRLVREVEARRGVSIQPEARRQLTRFRLNALKVTDPVTYELEALRAEMLESERKVSMLVRHQEALHDLLEKRESEIRSVQGELEKVRLDSTADLVRAERAEVELRQRVKHHSTECDRLVQEIARLKSELSEITTLKADAEQRCVELEAQVRAMEEALAARPGMSGETQLPLGALKEQLAGLVDAGEQREASREVTEAAWGRSIDEVADLVGWLAERRDHSRRDRLITEVAHVRDVEELAEFGRQIRSPKGFFPLVLIEETAAVRSPQEIVQLHNAWHTNETPDYIKGSLLASLIRSLREDVVETLAQLDPNDTSAITILKRTRMRTGHERRCVRIVAELESKGYANLATALCEGAFMRSSKLNYLLSGLEHWQCVHFAIAMQRAEPIEVITQWLLKEFDSPPVYEGDVGALNYRVVVFIDTLRTTGRLSQAQTIVAAIRPRRRGASRLLSYLEKLG
ncbi:hypothetical protein ACF1AO_37060 [Streptomyces longwoodensis]|uniref:hypothetical protein n=1 Tax=Streptomyces longwoodensis TaxID=68231 RepID=UPI0036F89FA2